MMSNHENGSINEIIIEDINVDRPLRVALTDEEHLATKRASMQLRHFDRELGVRAVHLMNPEADSSSGVAVIYPFGEGDTDRMRDTLAIIQDLLPDHPNVYGFPNNARNSWDIHEVTNQRVKQASKAMRAGHFYPFAENIVSYLEHEEVADIHAVGLQAGASIANLLDAVAYDQGTSQISTKTLIEPANTQVRDRQQLLHAMKTAAYGSHLRVFANWKATRLLADQLDIYRFDPVSEAMLEGLGKGNFAEDYAHSDPAIATVVIRGIKSLVCPPIALDGLHDHTILFAKRASGAEIINNGLLVAQSIRQANQVQAAAQK